MWALVLSPVSSDHDHDTHLEEPALHGVHSLHTLFILK